MQTRSGRILPAVSGFKMTIDQAGEVYAVSYCEGLKKYCRDMDIEFIFLNDFKLVSLKTKFFYSSGLLSSFLF